MPDARLRHLSRTIGRVDRKAFDRFEAAGWAGARTGYARHFVTLTGQVVPDCWTRPRSARAAGWSTWAAGPGTPRPRPPSAGRGTCGLDVTPEMVAIARGRHPDLTFEVGDAQELPFPDASRDAVVGNFVILHLGDPERVAAEAARVLAPGGGTAFSTWDLPATNRFLGVFVEAITEVGAVPPADLPAGPPFFRFADETAFAELLTGAGFADVRVRTVAFGTRFAGAEEMWGGSSTGTVRTRPMLLVQSGRDGPRIRSLRPPVGIRDGDGLLMPVSVKIASGVRR